MTTASRERSPSRNDGACLPCVTLSVLLSAGIVYLLWQRSERADGGIERLAVVEAGIVERLLGGDTTVNPLAPRRSV